MGQGVSRILCRSLGRKPARTSIPLRNGLATINDLELALLKYDAGCVRNVATELVHVLTMMTRGLAQQPAQGAQCTRVHVRRVCACGAAGPKKTSQVPDMRFFVPLRSFVVRLLTLGRQRRWLLPAYCERVRRLSLLLLCPSVSSLFSMCVTHGSLSAEVIVEYERWASEVVATAERWMTTHICCAVDFIFSHPMEGKCFNWSCSFVSVFAITRRWC